MALTPPTVVLAEMPLVLTPTLLPLPVWALAVTPKSATRKKASRLPDSGLWDEKRNRVLIVSSVIFISV
jgi:hypothetical protein